MTSVITPPITVGDLDLSPDTFNRTVPQGYYLIAFIPDGYWCMDMKVSSSRTDRIFPLFRSAPDADEAIVGHDIVEQVKSSGRDVTVEQVSDAQLLSLIARSKAEGIKLYTINPPPTSPAKFMAYPITELEEMLRG